MPLPHSHLSGRPRELARRYARFAARNSASESANSSLQCGYRIASKGGDRCRVYDLDTLETMIWLGYGNRALLLILAHRENLDEVNERLELLHRSSTT